jgi:hypothetical protein
VLIIALTLLTFARVPTAEFVRWDDRGTLHQNPRLNPPTWSHLAAYWREWDRGEHGLYVPVTATVWTALAAVGRVDPPDLAGVALNPWVFHGASVIVHVISAVLAFQILNRLIGSPVAAMLGAMIFAVHPVQVEPVAWASGLKDVLSGMLALAAILAYVIAAQRSQQRGARVTYVVAIVMALLAMLAKPSAVMVGPICFVIDALLIRRSARRATLAVLPMLIIALPIALIARHVQQVNDVPSVALWNRPLVALDAITFYLVKLVTPWNLVIDYGRRPEVILGRRLLIVSALVPIVVTALLLRWRRREPAAGALIFLLALLPVLGLATFQFQQFSTVADHYLYLAMLGPALLIAWFVAGRGRIARAIAAAVVLLLAARSFHQTGYWHDDFALLPHVLRVNPRSFAVTSNLGGAYQQQASNEHFYAVAAEQEGNLAAAGLHRRNARVALERAIKLFDESAKLSPPASTHRAGALQNLAAAQRAAAELSQ